MCDRIDKPITKEHLLELYQLAMCRMKKQREGHTDDQRKGHDISCPFAVALCQGAAMHYLDKPSIKDGKAYKGVRDFDIWCFYRKTTDKFLFGKQGGLVDEFDIGYFGKRKIDIMMRDIDYKDDEVESIQNWLKTSHNKSPTHLSEKAVILIYPKIRAIWCEGKAC